MAALEYRQVRDIYNSLRDAGAIKASMPDWAREMNARTGGDMFSAGERDGWWTRASTWVDENIFEPIGRATTEPLLGAVGDIFGAGDVGREIGRSLPRSLVNMAPMLIPGVGLIGTAARFGGTALLTGAHTLAETGSAKAGVVSGATSAAMLPAGVLGARIGRTLGGGRISEYIGSQTAAVAPAAVGAAAQQEILDPEGEFSWKGFAVETALSQIPFTVYDLVKMKTRPADVTTPVVKPATTTAATPAAPVKAESPEARATLDAMIERHAAVVASPEATQEQIAESFKQLRMGVLAPETVEKIKANTAATVRSNEEVQIAGRARKTKGGWKVFVEDPGTAVNVNAEQTVFVNGDVEPTTDAQSGMQIFKVKAGQINASGVEFPLTRDMFVSPFDENQPDLPPQARPAQDPTKPVTPDVTQALEALGATIEPAAQEVLPEVGLTLADDNDAAVDPMDFLRDQADVFEEAKARENEARARATAPIATAEDMVAVVPETKAIDTSAPEVVARRRQLANQIEVQAALLHDMRTGKLGRGITRKGIQDNENLLHQLENEYNSLLPAHVRDKNKPIKPKPVEVRIAEDVKKGATATQAIERVRLQQATPEVDRAMLDEALAAAAAQGAARQVHKTVSEWNNKPQNKYAERIRHPEGRAFVSRAEALEYQNANPDLAQHVIRNAGRTKAGEERGFYLARVINKEASLDAPRGTGEGETTMHNILPAEEFENPIVGQVESEADALSSTSELATHLDIADVIDEVYSARPEESLNQTITALDAASKNPRVFMNEAGFDDLPDTLLAIRQARVAMPLALDPTKPPTFDRVNAALKAANLKTFASEREMQTTLRKVRQGADVVRKLRSPALGSVVPYDTRLADEIGILNRGISAALDWYAARPEAGIIGDMFRALRRAVPNLDDEVTLRFAPHEGFYYWPGFGGSDKPRINIPYFPTNLEDAGPWSWYLAHEVAHHSTRELMTRNDPAAVEFRAVLKEIIEAVRINPAIPKKVRNVIPDIVRWAKEMQTTGNADAMHEKVKKVLGEEGTREWIEVAYALQSEEELVSGIFSSPELVAVLRKTKATRSAFQSVLDFFSDAWNRLIGVAPEKRDALTQILQHYDNYLGGAKARSRYNGSQYIEDALIADGVRPEALASRIHTVKNVFVTGDLTHSIEGFVREGEHGIAPASATTVPPKDLPIIRPVVGLKRPWLTEANQRIMAQLALGKRRVLDTFLGSGITTSAMRQLGFRGELVQNERDPTVANALTHIIRNRETALTEVQGLVDQLTATTDPKQFNEIVHTHPNKELALFVGSQANFMDRSLEKSHRLVPHPKKYTRLRDLPRRLERWLELEPALASQDGFDMIAQAGAGDLVVVDPPYLGTDTYRTNLQRSGVDEVSEALHKGASVLYFNSYSDDLRQQLEGMGLTVKREMIGNTDTIVAHNKLEDPVNINEPLRVDLTTGKADEVYASTLNLLAHEVPLHQELWNQMRQDVKLATQLYTNIKKGLVPGSLPPNAAENLKLAQVRVNAMRKALDKQALALERIKDVMAFHPEGFEELQAAQLTTKRLPNPPDPSGLEDLAHGLLGLRRYSPVTELSEVRRRTSAEALEGKSQLGFLERNLAMTQFVKQLHPEFRAVANHVRLHIAKTTERGNTLRLSYSHNLTTNAFDPAIAKSNIRVAQTEGLWKAASDIKRHANIEEAAGRQWTFDDPPIKAILNRLNPADRAAVRLEIDSARSRHRAWTEVVLPEAMTELNHEQTARVFAVREVGMKPDVARSLSQRLYSAIAAMQDPYQAPLATDMLKTLSQEVSAPTFQAALAHASDNIERVNQFLDFMRTRPSYVSESRFDKHHLVMRGPNGEHFRDSKPTKEALMKVRDAQLARGYTFLEYIPKSDERSLAAGVRQEVIDRLAELDKQSYNSLEQALNGAPPEVVAAALSETQRAEQYRTAIDAFKPTPGVSRKFIEGREYINMLENDEQFYARANNWLRHRLTRASTSLDMLDPALAGNRELLTYSQEHVTQSLTPDNPLFRKLTESVYFMRLGYSLGNGLLEGVQNLTTGMQQIIAETGSVTDAYKLWGGAVKEIAKRVKTGKWSPELLPFIDKAAQYGLKEMTSYSDIIDPDTEAVYSIASRRQGPLGKVTGVAQHGARKWSVFFQRWNDLIGLIAGRELALSRGMNEDDAFNFAWDLKDRGMFSGGKSQRPVGLWSIKTKAVPQMMSALQTYTLGWFSQMATHYKIGFKDVPGDFTEVQRSGARKAFVYGLAAQAVLAGALGLPGMSQGMAVVKQASGLDIKGWLRSNLASLFDEDEEAGGWMTNLAMRGGLAGVSPVDPSNRAAISFPFLGIDPYKGFDIAQLLGAPGATVADAVKGTLALASGDIGAVRGLLPSAVKPAAQLIQGEGDIRDRRGALLYKLSPFEKFITALGLPPSRIQQARDVAESVRNINEQAQRRREQDVDTLAESYRKEGAQAAQSRVLRYLQDNPQVEGKELVRAIARRVEAQTMPYDYRRELNIGANLEGLGSRMPSTESARRQLRYGVQETLGLRSRVNLGADRRASLVDELLDSNPYMTGAEARQVVSETLRGRRRSSELQIPGFQ